MTVPAILVDGVGRTKEITLHESLAVLRIPVWDGLSFWRDAKDQRYRVPAFGQADFYRIGKLPNDVQVYGYAFEQEPYELWYLKLEIAPQLESDSRYQNVINQEIQHQIDALKFRHPLIRLYDETTGTHTRTRIVIGVARKQS